MYGQLLVGEMASSCGMPPMSTVPVSFIVAGSKKRTRLPRLSIITRPLDPVMLFGSFLVAASVSAEVVTSRLARMRRKARLAMVSGIIPLPPDAELIKSSDRHSRPGR
jgi:hypothetical protein